jgi:plasmid replication initiation protein
MIALKLAIQDKDYHVFRNQVLKSANETKSDIHDLSITKDYPKVIEW